MILELLYSPHDKKQEIAIHIVHALCDSTLHEWSTSMNAYANVKRFVQTHQHMKEQDVFFDLTRNIPFLIDFSIQKNTCDLIMFVCLAHQENLLYTYMFNALQKNSYRIIYMLLRAFPIFEDCTQTYRNETQYLKDLLDVASTLKLKREICYAYDKFLEHKMFDERHNKCKRRRKQRHPQNVEHIKGMDYVSETSESV